MTASTVLDVGFARGLATAAHRGQREKDRSPYINHPARVAAAVPSPYRPLAWLHDLVEDADWDSADLADLGYDEPFLADLELLTKRPHPESYADRVDRVVASGRARPLVVKLADVDDHLRLDGEGAPLIGRLVAAGKFSARKVDEYRAAADVLRAALASHAELAAAELLVWGAIVNGRWSALLGQMTCKSIDRATSSVLSDPGYRDEIFTDAVRGVDWPDVGLLIDARDVLSPGSPPKPKEKAHG